MIYFNNAAKARFSPAVVAIGTSCIQQDPWETIHCENDKDRVRELYARLVGSAGGSQDVAIMPSTAFAMTLAARNLKDTVRGGKILLLQDQYPSCVYPWQDLCATSNGKFTLEILPFPKQGQENWTSLIVERISNSQYVIACLPPLFWCDGSLIDLDKIGPMCKDKGIALIVDATQAVGIYPVNVQSIQPAMVACSTHKWLRGPAGTCLVYVDPDHVKAWQPLDQHDRARDWHGRSVADRDAMTPNQQGYPQDFLPGARKLDAGGRTQPILMPMLRVALEAVVEIHLEQAQRELYQLMQPLKDWAATPTSPVHPLPMAGHAAHILGLMPQPALPTEKMLSIVKRLTKEFHIVLSVRCGVFRISPYLDNTAADVRNLVEALQQVLQ